MQEQQGPPDWASRTEPIAIRRGWGNARWMHARCWVEAGLKKLNYRVSADTPAAHIQCACENHVFAKTRARIRDNAYGLAVYSLVIPVYRNRESLPGSSDTRRAFAMPCGTGRLVVDAVGRFLRMAESPNWLGLDARLILLARNFGSFAAITAGLGAGGDYFAVLAADLQN